MSKKLLATVTAVVLVAIGVGTLALTAGASPDGQSIGPWGRKLVESESRTAAPTPLSHEGGDTIVVRGRTLRDKSINVNGPHFGPGDYSVFKERLTNRAGTHVGTDNIICTIHYPHKERFGTLCEGTYTFFGRGGIKKGTISIEGLLLFGPGVGSFTFAITGGTGHYQNVRGEMHLGLGRTTQFTFHLIP